MIEIVCYLVFLLKISNAIESVEINRHGQNTIFSCDDLKSHLNASRHSCGHYSCARKQNASTARPLSTQISSASLATSWSSQPQLPIRSTGSNLRQSENEHCDANDCCDKEKRKLTR